MCGVDEGINSGGVDVLEVEGVGGEVAGHWGLMWVAS